MTSTQSVGIFRLAPEKDECQRIKNQIDSGEYNGCTDVNVLANLIKVMNTSTLMIIIISLSIRFSFVNYLSMY